MSHLTDWRCTCGRGLGVVARAGRVWKLKLGRSIEEALIAPGSAGVICPACGEANVFEPREMAQTSAP